MEESEVVIASMPSPIGTARPSAPPKLWKYSEVAALLRVSTRTLHNWVKAGQVPGPRRFGYTSRFSEEEVAEMLKGVKLTGTYEVVASPREKSSRKGGKSTAKKAKGKHPSRISPATKPVAVKPRSDRKAGLVKKGGKR